MKRKRILDVGYGINSLFNVYKTEQLSSRALYGLVELSDKYNYDVEYISLQKSGILRHLKNNILLFKPADGIIMPYLFIQPLLLFAFLRLFGLIKEKKLIIICHKTLVASNGLKKVFYKIIYDSVDVFLFHSPKNLLESLKCIDKNKTKFMLWGENLSFVDKMFSIKEGDFFLSTGRENRDFEMLISAFSCLNSNLKIFTNTINYSTNYEFLKNLPPKQNIDVNFVDRSNSTTMFLAQQVAECFCVVIPVTNSKLDYCVGLTSIVEAMAFGKPIIATRNPYSPIDIEKEGVGIWVETLDDWIRAISYLHSNVPIAKAMGRRGRLLAEKEYNIDETAKMLNSVLS